METILELKKWVESLAMGERRFVHAQARARSRDHGSQQLELMLWLEQATAPISLPSDAGFMRNLPVVAHRLRELILDCLHLLHKNADEQAARRTLMDEVAILMARNLTDSATRRLNRAKKDGLACSDYLVVLQCLEWERSIIRAQRGKDWLGELAALREEQQQVLRALDQRAILEQVLDELRALTRQAYVPQAAVLPHHLDDPAIRAAIDQFAQRADRLEAAWAIHILGITDVLAGRLEAAILRYEHLFHACAENPIWLSGQEDLMLSIINHYQLACFFSSLTFDQVQTKLQQMPVPKRLRKDQAYHFQRRVHLYSFTLALNTGKIAVTLELIPQIQAWLKANQGLVMEQHVLPFLNNFAVAEFFSGNHRAAIKHVAAILQTPNRKVRVDIRDFALLLQLILAYELGDFEWMSFLLRAAKRHFRLLAQAVPYQLAVIKCLESLQAGDAGLERDAFAQLEEGLLHLAEQATSSALPLGFAEVRLWAAAKQQDKPLIQVFQTELAGQGG